MKSAALAVVLMVVATMNTWAQTFPARPVTMVLAYPPGGFSDAVGRPVAEGMRDPLGQTVVTENVGGANGAIGSARVARAAPDGYTIMLGIWNTHVAVAKLLKLDYDVVKDFTPVIFMADSPVVMVVHRSVQAKSFKDLVDWLHANPAKGTSGSTGIGSVQHLIDETLRKQLKVRLVTAHYRGAGPLMQDLMGGHIQLTYINPATAAPHLRSGVIRALAVTSAKRMKVLPDVPTMVEAGFPGGLEFSLWAGLFAPKGTPAEIVGVLNHAAMTALATPRVRDLFAEQGLDIATRARQTPQTLAEVQRVDIAKWWPMMDAAGITPQ